MTTQPTLGQLDLFGSPQDRSLKAENAWLQQRLERARVEFRKLREERDAVACACGELQDNIDVLHAQLRHWTTKYNEAQRDARHWQSLCELERMVRTMGTTRAPTRETALKQLLSIAHPDRWSRGQPATELAHELTVTINRLREEGQP